MPREVFEQLMAGVAEGDCQKLRRDPQSNQLLPTQTTATLHRFEYEIRKGSVTDRLFRMQELDPPPPRQLPALTLAQIGDPDVYEVEAIRAKRLTAKRVKYLIQWRGFDESHNSWEAPANINKQLVAQFEAVGAAARTAVASSSVGTSALVAPQQCQPSLPNRGQGAARAHLSAAAQRRGRVPSVLSMVCGNVIVKFKESRTEKTMPTLSLVFKVLTMDSAGHITWPQTFSPQTQAALRLQARALLRTMIDDPLNPCDATMEPAMTGTGTSSVWQAPPKRQMVWVQPGQRWD